MGFFKKRPAAAPAAVRPPPSTVASVSDADLARARRVLTQFEQAVSTQSDGPVRSSVLAVATAGGAPTLEQSLWNLQSTGDTGMDRPWRWLAAVAREAGRQADPPLVAQVALFTLHFQTSIAPKIGVADQMDMLLGGASAVAVAEICCAALPSLATMDPETLVIDSPIDKLTARQLLCGTAQLALRQSRSLLPEETLEQANAALGDAP